MRRAALILAGLMALSGCSGVATAPDDDDSRGALSRGEASLSSDPDPDPDSGSQESGTPEPPAEDDDGDRATDEPRGVVTLGFAGDIHFEWHLGNLLQRPRRSALGPIAAALREPDVTMVNLETAITRRGTQEPKKFWFRTSPEALDVLDAAGVDIVTLANNHAVDYGPVGLQDTLRAVRRSPVPVVGIGRNAKAAYRPHRVTVGNTDLAFIAANARRERTSKAWSAREDRAGIAIARRPHPPRLLRAVREAAARDDVVVTYLHWGTELEQCPTQRQRRHARKLARAGADIIVGSHAHVLLGSGWLDDTYVSYGLGNFVWYNQYRDETGVLNVRIRNGEVVADSLVPARIQADGTPRPLRGADRRAAVRDWRQLRGCTDLAAEPPSRR